MYAEKNLTKPFDLFQIDGIILFVVAKATEYVQML
jgi:hypothetical protein